MSTVISKVSKLPKAIESIPKDQLKIVLPDVSVSIEGVTTCNKISFKITFVPGLFPSKVTRGIEWRVTDKVNGISETVGEGTAFIRGTGGFAIVSLEFPMPIDTEFIPDFSNEITVQVDPNRKILERSEKNNQVSVIGVCIG